MFAPYPQYGAWIHEIHHSAKKDAPSGTAITLQQGMKSAGYPHNIDMASSRAGSVPGTHTIGFDGPFETITMTHTNRDRAAFAQGALQAAKWVHGKRGWFTIRDVLGLWAQAQGSELEPESELEGIHENTIYRRWHRARDAVHDDRRCSTKPACGGWRGGRSTRAFTFSFRAARPARARRSPKTSELASSRFASRKRAAKCRCSPAPADTTLGRSFTRHARWSVPARMACFRSRPTTTSPRLTVSSSTTKPSPKARRCRSSSTTCPAAPAATSIPRRS